MNTNNIHRLNSIKKSTFLGLAFLLLFIGQPVLAQISHGGIPASFQLKRSYQNEKVYYPELPFSMTKRSSMSKQCTAYEFGKILPFNHRLRDADFGTSTVDAQGNLIWRAKLSSENALALGLYFSDFYIPKGAKLFVYSPDKKQLIGSFTEQNNADTKLFATELILGDALIIEYDEPANVAGQGHFKIDNILHAYRGVDDFKSSYGYGGSGACEVNVNCSEGIDYKKQRNSVVRLQIKAGSSSYWCTGSVINNVNNDRTPYILTADHCGTGATTSDLSQWIFYFNYQSDDCDDPISEPLAQTMTGATKIAASSNSGTMGSDFYLLLLNENIPVNYDAYFMGWDRTGDGSTNGVTIHHPEGDIKKISTYTSPLTTTTYTSGGYVGSQNGSWEVNWSETTNGHGVTEGGSSGSPIYSQDGFLIGTLTGGWASCSALTASDYYGKFDFHWDKNGTDANTQLKPWLDPDNTGTMFLSGVPVGIETPAKVSDHFFNLFPNPSNGQFSLRFNADDYGKTFTVKVTNLLGQNIYTQKLAIELQLNLNLQYLQKGVYFVTIEGDNQRQTKKISIQ
jgi:hypothetical protein